MKKLLYLFLTVLIVACSGEDGSNANDTNDGDNTLLICNGDNPVYLADNGVTIKACDFASVGDTGVIDGVTYTVVDEAMLREMVENEQDVTKVATTKVTNMSNLFFISYDLPKSNFNQPIGNWDTSNVTDISDMFKYTTFNQNISSWNVSSVADMGSMFEENDLFNQPIGNWDVSSVTDMGETFEQATSFNQPIGNWDVSNVIQMGSMIEQATSYNQDLSAWNVNGVTSCLYFSYEAPSWTLPQPNFTNCNPG